jgi:DNA-binding NarL/FixJ family response regulator
MTMTLASNGHTLAPLATHLKAGDGHIRVLLVDDHSVFRMGLRELLQADEGIEIVGEASSGEQAVAQTRQFRPDVILMDLRMPLQDGIETTRQIKAELPATEVVVLSAFEDDDQVLQAFDAGASGYVIKGDDLNSVLRAIHNASAGRLHLGPSIAKRILDRVARQGSPSESQPRRQSKSELTPRETTVLRLIAQGKKSREIASALGISERTVCQHKANIFSRLQIHHRADAIMYAIRKGLVQV